MVDAVEKLSARLDEISARLDALGDGRVTSGDEVVPSGHEESRPEATASGRPRVRPTRKNNNVENQR